MIDVIEMHPATDLPHVESFRDSARVGVVFRDRGEERVNLGGPKDEHLKFLRTEEMRGGAIKVDMYELDERTDADYAVITMCSKTSNRTVAERAIALRFGGTKPADLIERTPVQQFICRRNVVDIPLAGRARWLAISPEGEFMHGVYDERDPDHRNSVAMFGEGWTFVWIMEGSKMFKFGEVCSPRYIDSFDDCPAGPDGVKEDRFDELPPAFLTLFKYLLTGDHLKIRAN